MFLIGVIGIYSLLFRPTIEEKGLIEANLQLNKPFSLSKKVINKVSIVLMEILNG